MVGLGHERQVLPQIEQAAVPPRIIRLSDHVIVHVIAVELVEELTGGRLVSAFVDVDHDARARLIGPPCFDPGDPRLDEVRELVPMIGQFGIGPEHSVGDFVADLNHVREGAGFPKRLNGIAGVVVQSRHHFGMCHLFPRLGDELLAGIGPGV